MPDVVALLESGQVTPSLAGGRGLKLLCGLQPGLGEDVTPSLAGGRGLKRRNMYGILPSGTLLPP